MMINSGAFVILVFIVREYKLDDYSHPDSPILQLKIRRAHY